MDYLLKISSILNDEERQEKLSGTLPEVYQHLKEHCSTGEVIDIYESGVYIETTIRMNSSIAVLSHKLEW